MNPQKIKLIVVIAGWLAFSFPSSVSAELPPRPIPPAQNPTTELKGAKIILSISLNSEAEVTENTWTQVQWQDNSGTWHNVDGWGGQPTYNHDSHNYEVEWWLDKGHFAAGPFRWKILASKSDSNFAHYSDPFYLPSRSNTTTVIDF